MREPSADLGEERAGGQRNRGCRDRSGGQAGGDGEALRVSPASHVDVAGGVHGQRTDGCREVGRVEQLAAIGAEFHQEPGAGRGLECVVQREFPGGCGAGDIDVAGGVQGEAVGCVTALAAQNGEQDDLARGIELHNDGFGERAEIAASGEVGVARGISGHARDAVVTGVSDAGGELGGRQRRHGA